MYFYGASGHGKVVAEIAEINGLTIDGFIDNDPSKKEVLGYKVINSIPSKLTQIVVTIGQNEIRKKIVTNFGKVIHPVLIHPKANISTRSLLGEGTVVMAGVAINTHVIIGKHCIINTNASVDHDCIIEDFVHISPNVALAGNVIVGEGTHIGIGACIIQGIKVGSWCIIGAGAVIIRDVPDGSVVVGNPARLIKKKNNIVI